MKMAHYDHYGTAIFKTKALVLSVALDFFFKGKRSVKMTQLQVCSNNGFFWFLFFGYHKNRRDVFNFK